jgi:hypothetical protein
MRLLNLRDEPLCMQIDLLGLDKIDLRRMQAAFID